MKCSGKLLKFVLAGLLVLLASGCGESTDDDGGEEFRLNGEKPEVYYNQFLYSNEGGSFRYLIDDSPVNLSSVSKKKQVRGTVSLFLLSDRRFTLIYQESLTCTVGSVRAGIPIAYQIIEGSWNLQGTKLVLENVGKAHGVKVNDEESLTFQFEKNVTAAGASQKVFLLQMTSSSMGLEDQRSRNVQTVTIDQARAQLDQMDVNCRD